MDFEPRPRVMSFQSSSDDEAAKSVVGTARRGSISSTASGRRVSTVAPQGGRKASKAGTPYVSPYRLWRKLSDSIQNKKLTFTEEQQTVENTYRTEPKRKFPEREVREIIRNSLEDMLARQTYAATECGFLTKLLSSRIIEQVKSLNIERYKLVCLVNVGSKHDQGIKVASRCLWNAEYDTHVTATVENRTLFAVATVYGVYFE